MVLIISTDFDQNTTTVINWLIFSKIPFIRINENDYLEDILFRDDDIIIKIKGEDIYVNKINSCWYRRGGLYFSNTNFVITDTLISQKFTEDLNKFKKREIGKCIEYIYSFLSSLKYSLGNFYNTDINKLWALKCAKDVGLETPNTLITNNKNEILDFCQKMNDIITKPISEVANFSNNENKELRLYTKKLTPGNINHLNFFYSKVQQEIIKKYELRSFFIDKKLYTMAIFSQKDNKTKIDFRNYNKLNPNRNVPFKLPDAIEDKLLELMDKLNLKTGSIDLIYGIDRKYYFLEINPVGQFGMTSYPCNYYLEKIVANYLNT
jgi:ATP-GRASP peptide maturase of grasp-with-spasm system